MSHIHIVPHIFEVVTALFECLSDIIYKRVDQACTNDDKPFLVCGWRMSDTCIIPLSIRFQKDLIDIDDQRDNVNDMNECSDHMLTLGKSLPFVIDEILHEFCFENLKLVRLLDSLHELPLLL